MRLSAADVAALPLAAALFDRDGAILASSPEWCGGGLGTVAYRLPSASLAVACDEQDADIAQLLVELVAAVGAASRAPHGDQQRRLKVLAASVALVAGIPMLTNGTTDDVLDNLTAVLSSVSNHPVTVIRHHRGDVADASVMALAIRQLVINARRHDDATDVALSIDAGPTFTVEWRGLPVSEGVITSRHQGDRDRWGLGFVRLAMDALGGVYLAPAIVAPGQLRAVLAIDGSPRMLLPLAAIRDGVVLRATPAWDEETHAVPGSPAPERWRTVIREAADTPGTIAREGSMRARVVGATTWAAIPAQGTADAARDVIRGLDHERDLFDVAEPFATTILGLAAIIGLLLGDRPRRVNPAAFDEQFPVTATAMGVASLVSPFTGAAAPEPALVAVLASRLGATVTNRDNRIALHVVDAHRGDPLTQRLADGEGVILLP